MSGVKKLGEVAFPEAGLLTSAGGMVHQHPIEQPIRDQVRAYSSRSASRCAGTYREKLISPQNPA
jgi:hypothetical protein